MISRGATALAAVPAIVSNFLAMSELVSIRAEPHFRLLAGRDAGVHATMMGGRQ